MTLILYLGKTQDILNDLQLYVLVFSFIDIVMHLIEDTSDFFSSFSSFAFEKKAFNILGIIEII